MFLLAVRDKLKRISHEEFEHLNWLPLTYMFNQYVTAIVFKYFNDQCPNYLKEVFDVATERNFQLRGSFEEFSIKRKCSFRKTNNGQLALSYIGLTFRNKTPDIFKRSNNLNTFQHYLKKYFLNGLKNYNNSF